MIRSGEKTVIRSIVGEFDVEGKRNQFFLCHLDASLRKRVLEKPPGKPRWTVLVGVAAERLIDGILDVGQPDVISLAQKPVVFGRVVAELRPAISVPDRANAVAGSSEAMGSGCNAAAVAQFRREPGRHPVRGRIAIAPVNRWRLGVPRRVAFTSALKLRPSLRIGVKLDECDDSLYGWAVEVLLRHRLLKVATQRGPRLGYRRFGLHAAGWALVRLLDELGSSQVLP